MSDNRLTLVGSVELQAAAGDKTKRPTVSILAYTGGPMTVGPYGPLAIDLQGMELPSRLPVLLDHRNEIDAIAAEGTPQASRGQLHVTGPIAVGTPAGDRVLALAASGVNLAASVGAEILQSRRLRAGDAVAVNGQSITAGDAGLLVVEKSRLREVSLTAVGADGHTAVDVAAKGPKMQDTIPVTTTTTPAADPAIQAAVIAERNRLNAIDQCVSGLHLQGGFRQQGDQLAIKCRNGEIDLPALQAALLTLLRAERSTAACHISSGSSGPPAEPADLLCAAAMMRLGREPLAVKAFGPAVLEGAKGLKCRHALDLFEAALTLEGRPVPSNRDAMLRAAFSTSSLPIALGSAANKILLDAYAAAPATWRSFCRIVPLKDFKPGYAVRPSFLAALEQLSPTGEIHHASALEETAAIQLNTFAKMFAITRHDLINDDLSAFDTLPAALGKSAARSLSDLVYTVLLANGGSFFDAGNSNYLTGASSVLGSTSLATGIRTLMQQVDAAGNTLDIMPRVLLVPPELFQTGKELVVSELTARYVSSSIDRQPTGNALQNALDLQIESRLSNAAFSGYSATAWYVLAAPQDSPMIVGFLNGQETPTVEMDSTDFNTLGMQWRVFHDYAASLCDYRAAVKSAGA